MHERFFLSHEFSYEKCSEIFPEMFEPLFCGSEKIPGKFPPNFPLNFPNFPAKNKKKFTDELLQERRERLVFVAYGQLAWSFLLTVEIRFGLLCLRWKSVWSFLLTVPPWPEIRFGLFCLRFPLSGNWVWSFLLTVPPP